jgi:hypothetical protein
VFVFANRIWKSRRDWTDYPCRRRRASNDYALTWGDAATWGLLLADVISFIGSIYEAESLQDREAAVDRIIAGMRAELGDRL